jgi:hypothetical protein
MIRPLIAALLLAGAPARAEAPPVAPDDPATHPHAMQSHVPTGVLIMLGILVRSGKAPCVLAQDIFELDGQAITTVVCVLRHHRGDGMREVIEGDDRPE